LKIKDEQIENGRVSGRDYDKANEGGKSFSDIYWTYKTMIEERLDKMKKDT